MMFDLASQSLLLDAADLILVVARRAVAADVIPTPIEILVVIGTDNMVDRIAVLSAKRVVQIYNFQRNQYLKTIAPITTAGQQS